jgi:hypothetical protein
MTAPCPMPPRPTGSIRQPGASPRAPRLLQADPPAAPGPSRPRPAIEARAPKAKPDPRPLRLMLGFAGVASASAFTVAMLPSVAPAQQAGTADALNADAVAAAAVVPQPSVLHVTKYVTLQPGQTAPPQSTVIVQPTPTPIVKVQVVTRTRQSGKP